jgi:hypothetical protein
MKWLLFLITLCSSLAMHSHTTQALSYNQKSELDLLKKQQGGLEKLVEDISSDL